MSKKKAKPKVDNRKVCPVCKGSGLDLVDSEVSCSRCNGAGRV